MAVMEEMPIQKAETETRTAEIAKPETAGDIFRYEDLPPSEPPPLTFPLSAEREPKLLLSRKKLRAKIDRYKEQKLKNVQETLVETNQTADLPESHFDRRREAIDETTKSIRMAEGMIAIGEVLKESAKANASVKAQSLSAYQDDSPAQVPVQNSPLSFSFKKAIIFGMVSGLAVGLILILIYAK